MRILHHALSIPDMPNRRLPCPSEQRTTSSKRKRIQSDQSARDPLTQKRQLRCFTKHEKPLTPLSGSLTHTIGGSHLRGDRFLRVSRKFKSRRLMPTVRSEIYRRPITAREVVLLFPLRTLSACRFPRKHSRHRAESSGKQKNNIRINKHGQASEKRRNDK
jgi:hypothetical protein